MLLIVPPCLSADNCPLKGKWQSDSERTLTEVKKAENISKEMIEYFSKGYFGKLAVEFTCDEIISSYENEKNSMKYKVTKAEGNFITIEFFEKALAEYSQETLELVGDCYYSPIYSYGFKEAMCRVNK